MCKEKKMIFTPAPFFDYSPPKLTEGKIWYISYYVRDPASGKMKRFRIKVNRIQNKLQRRKLAKQIMSALENRLSLGWSPFLDSVAAKSSDRLSDALDAFLKAKRKEMELQSFRSYQSFLRIFSQWVEERKIHLVCSFTKAHAREYLDYIDEREGVSARTYNNYLSFQNALWEWLKEKGYAAENVFRDFKKKPKRLMQKKRRLFSPEEPSALFSFLRQDHPEYLAAVVLCLCCFIRPKEIALLKCSDLNLDNQVVHIRPEIAKNDKESWRTIPDEALPILGRLELSRPEFYVFGKNRGKLRDFRPAANPCSEKKFADYWDTVVRPACKFGKDLQFYSLKDTGITNALEVGVPINQVQQQADHSSVAMTAIYVGHKAKASDELRRIHIEK